MVITDHISSKNTFSDNVCHTAELKPKTALTIGQCLRSMRQQLTHVFTLKCNPKPSLITCENWDYFAHVMDTKIGRRRHYKRLR